MLSRLIRFNAWIRQHQDPVDWFLIALLVVVCSVAALMDRAGIWIW